MSVATCFALPGLKPAQIEILYAALKRRSSTVLPYNPGLRAKGFELRSNGQPRTAVLT
jgi:hypothetical protein